MHAGATMPQPDPSQVQGTVVSHGRRSPDATTPFEDDEFLPGLGTAVFWVVLSYVFVNLVLMPAYVV
jgi:hypothetical protein